MRVVPFRSERGSEAAPKMILTADDTLRPTGQTHMSCLPTWLIPGVRDMETEAVYSCVKLGWDQKIQMTTEQNGFFMKSIHLNTANNMFIKHILHILLFSIDNGNPNMDCTEASGQH